MAEVQIGLILTFLIFFVMTRTVFVHIINDGNFRIEVHLPLLALCLSESAKEQEKDNAEEKLSARSYVKIASRTLEKIKSCEVYVNGITLPCRTDSFDGFTFVRPFGYQFIIYSLIAYFKTKVRRLVLSDNAVISSPNVDKTQFNITFKLGLFHLIRAALSIKHSIEKEKKEKRLKNVGE